MSQPIGASGDRRIGRSAHRFQRADRAATARQRLTHRAYRAKKTGKSPAAVKKAVKAAGPMRKNVEKKLRGK